MRMVDWAVRSRKSPKGRRRWRRFLSSTDSKVLRLSPLRASSPFLISRISCTSVKGHSSRRGLLNGAGGIGFTSGRRIGGICRAGRIGGGIRRRVRIGRGSVRAGGILWIRRIVRPGRIIGAGRVVRVRRIIRPGGVVGPRRVTRGCRIGRRSRRIGGARIGRRRGAGDRRHSRAAWCRCCPKWAASPDPPGLG